MKTIKFTDGVSGLTASYAAGQTVEFSNENAKMYVKAKKAVYVAAEGDEKQRIDEQNTEITALTEANEHLAGVLKNTEKWLDHEKQQVLVLTASCEKLVAALASAESKVAELLNEPVDDETGDDGETSDETIGDDDKSSDATTGDNGDNSTDALTGDDDKLSDTATGDGDAGDVKPAVVVGADGKRKKAMPRKGGVAAE
ncbi:MAG: hypothetical protein COC24_018175 [Alphaproteobacteria bacterium]|nr:hypothetical protein [Alphaproteobacteria bacterium]